MTVTSENETTLDYKTTQEKENIFFLSRIWAQSKWTITIRFHICSFFLSSFFVRALMMTRAKMTGEFALVKKRKKEKPMGRSLSVYFSYNSRRLFIFFKKMSKSPPHARPTACTGLTLVGASLAFLDTSLSWVNSSCHRDKRTCFVIYDFVCMDPYSSVH